MHEPGTRVTSMMAPTLVLRDGEIELALGSAGSNRLRSAILQVIRYVVDYGMDVDEAVRRGRIHYEAGVLHAEPGLRATAALDELERRGYQLVRWKGSTCSSAARRPCVAIPTRASSPAPATRAGRRRPSSSTRSTSSTTDSTELHLAVLARGRRSSARRSSALHAALNRRASSRRRSCSERSSSRPCFSSGSISTLAAISYALSSASAPSSGRSSVTSRAGRRSARAPRRPPRPRRPRARPRAARPCRPDRRGPPGARAAGTGCRRDEDVHAPVRPSLEHLGHLRRAADLLEAVVGQPHDAELAVARRGSSAIIVL